jgi:chromosome segregation and condensation protein ScpB
MTTKELLKAFEAVLFASGEPLSIDRFSQVFEITPEKTVSVESLGFVARRRRSLSENSVSGLLQHRTEEENKTTANKKVITIFLILLFIQTHPPF